MSVLRVPSFHSEAEEAQWWYDHRDEVAEDMVAAAEAGLLGEGTRGRLKRLHEERAADLPRSAKAAA